MLHVALLTLTVLGLSASTASAAESRLFQESFGPDGTGASAFEHAAAVGVDQSTGDVYLAEKAAGTVQKFNAANEPEAFTGLAPNIVLGKLTGFEFSALPAVSQIAVDSTNHVFFVAALEGGAVKAFQPDGEPADFTAGPDSGTNELTGTEPCGVAVDSNGAIYVSFADGVHVFSSTGESLTTFAPPPFFPCNLAVDSHGVVYASPYPGGVDKFVPTEGSFPVTASSTYEPPVTVDETAAKSVAVDPVSDDVFVDEGTQVAEYGPTGKRLGAFGAEGEGALTASEGIAINSAAARIYVSEAEGKKQIGVFAPLPPPEPVISGESATNLTANAVDLNANVNPGGQETTCSFQFGTDTGYGETFPCSPQPGKGTAGVALTQHVTELHHDTPYHWRVVATNAAGTTTGPDHVFNYTTAGEGLPDNRAYEMVTPPVKNAALIGNVILGLLPDIAADGSRLILSTLQCFGNAGSCGAVRGNVGTPYAFSRGGSGWIAHALAPPSTQFEASTVANVNPDTGAALVSAPTPSHGQDDWYARQLDGSLTDIGPVTNPELGAQGPVYHLTLATPDLSHLVVEAQARSTGWPETANLESGALFEYTGTENPRPTLVGVRGGPGSTDSISLCGTVVGGNSEVSQGLALSADGRTVVFTAAHCSAREGHPAVPANELYARIEESETVKLSEAECGADVLPEEVACRSAAPADANFVGASVAGTRAFFTSPQQLTDNATEDANAADNETGTLCRSMVASGCNLYEYDFANPVGQRLVAVSAGDTSGGGPRVQGVVAISDDGSHVYFVARSVLSAAANGEGATAQAGKENLYVFERDGAHPAGVTRFIATLSKKLGSGQDQSDRRLWEEGAIRPANVSSDGRFLVFTSQAPLTKDDTRPDGGPAQVFRYDALTGDLVRLSIGANGFNDNGNAGVGDAIIAAGSSFARFAGDSGRRDPSMSDDGHRVFFTSPVGLTAKALNDTVVSTAEGIIGFAQNVYEWEQEGAGSCPAGRGSGCVFLISSGRDVSAIAGPSCNLASSVCLVSTDETGSNVFFTTTDQLVPGDTDTQLDYYDARICEPEHANPCVTAAPAPLPPCLGEACHGVPPATPGAPNAPSATFNGTGNATPSPQGGPTKPACASSSGSPSRSCTRKQNLTKALATCKHHFAHTKKKRQSCERTAHKKYGPVKKRK